MVAHDFGKTAAHFALPHCIKHAEISDQMLFVVPRECWIGGRQIGDSAG
jgi:hypothetical protein